MSQLIYETACEPVALASIGGDVVAATAGGEMLVGTHARWPARRGIRAIATSPDAIAAIAGDELVVWSVAGEQRNAWRFAGERLQAIAFTERLLVASDREVLRVVDPATGEVVGQLSGGERNTSIALHPDGSVAQLCCFQGGSTISIDGVPQVASSFDALSSGAFNGDGALYACADRCMKIYRYPSFQVVHAFDYDGHRVDAPRDGLSLEATWSPAAFVAGRLVAGSPLGSVFVWDVATGALAQRWAAHRGGVTELVALGDRLATAGEDGVLRVWRL